MQPISSANFAPGEKVIGELAVSDTSIQRPTLGDLSRTLMSGFALIPEMPSVLAGARLGICRFVCPRSSFGVSGL